MHILIRVNAFVSDRILSMFTAILWLSPYGGAICLCCPHCGSAQTICLKSCLQLSLSQLKPVPTYAGIYVYMCSRGETYTYWLWALSCTAQYVWSYSSDKFSRAYVFFFTHWLNCGFTLIIQNTTFNKVLVCYWNHHHVHDYSISVENVSEFQVKRVLALIMQCCFDYLFQWTLCKMTNWKGFVQKCNSGME